MTEQALVWELFRLLLEVQCGHDDHNFGWTPKTEAALKCNTYSAATSDICIDFSSHK